MVRCKKHVAVLVASLSLAGLSISTLARQTLDDQVRSTLHVIGESVAGNSGLSPAQIRKAYGFDRVANRGAGQVIAIVAPFDHPRIEKDLTTFSRVFDLPDCGPDDGCFRKVFASGEQPPVVPVWTIEIALGVEWAHAIAPDAHILLVEAASSSLSDLLHAVDVAVQNGASVVAMSWGLPERAGYDAFDNHFVAAGVTFVASSGDFGNGVFYPAASPFVVGVGGTRLNLDQNGNYAGEIAWSGSGGGQSLVETEPTYQFKARIPNNPDRRRGVPDVAYDADPDTAIPVYDSSPLYGPKGWLQVGGTSIGSPQWAALFAIANSLRAAQHKVPLTGGPGVLYAVDRSTNFNDITVGINGSCGTLCTAFAGYDYVTGLGSPRADRLITALADQR